MKLNTENLTQESSMSSSESHTTEQETIFNIPLDEIKRQCQVDYIDSPFDQPLTLSQDSMDTVIEGGEKILNNPKTLKLVSNIYSQNHK